MPSPERTGALPGRWLRVALLLLPLPFGSQRLHATPPSELIKTDGRAATGHLVELDTNWRITLGTRDATTARSERGAKSTSWPIADWLYWGHDFDNRFDARVLLVDGSVLPGHVAAISARHVALDHASLGVLTIDRELVAGMIWHPPLDDRRRDELSDWLASTRPGASPLLRLANGDELAGTCVAPEALPQPLPLQLSAVLWRLADAPKPIELSVRRVRAIRWSQPMRFPSPDAAGIVALGDGTWLVAKSGRVTSTTLEAHLACGFDIRADRSGGSKLVAYLRPPARRFRFASDVRPSDDRHIPLFREPVPFRIDRSTRRTRLRAGGHRYEKGIGTFGRNRVVYDVPDDARAFSVEVGIDDVGDKYSSAIFRIYSVGKDGAIALAAQSATRYHGDRPQRLFVPVTDASRLVLLVDVADYLDRSDFADWLHPCWILK